MVSRRRSWWAAALALVCVTAGCSDPPPPAPAVLLVTFDTTRADRLGSYGHDAARTPRLDALARRGLQFDAAYTPTPLTLPAHTTLLTGTWPLSHGVRDNTLFTVAPAMRTLSEALVERGWRTGASVGAFVLDQRYGLDQGFESYAGPSQGASDAPTMAERPASAVIDDAAAWLQTVAHDERFFLWVHLFDPHHPYQAPAEHGGPTTDGYDAEIAYADAELGRLLDGLEATGRLAETLVIATSDHGESLGEHGEQSHGFFVYDAAVKVPLLVAGPGVPTGRVSAPVSLRDIAPTVLDWCAVPRQALPAATAASLLDSAAEGSTDNDRALYFETFLPFYAQRWAPMQGLLWRGHKFIQTRRPELYDLAHDGDELTNLIDAEPELAQTMGQRLAAFIAEHPPLGNALVDPARAQDLQALAALGYTAGHIEGDPFATDLLDAKDGIEDIVKEGTALFDLTRGRQLLGLPPGGGPGPAPSTPRAEDDGEGAEAWARLERAFGYYSELVSRYPGRMDLLAQLALAELSLGKHEAAADHCEQLVLAEDRQPDHRLRLGHAYAALGHPEWARAEMVKAVALDRRATVAYDWLARCHEQRGEYGQAAFWRAEQERFQLGDEALRLSARAERQRLEALAREQSQPIEAPGDYPKPDLTPERLR